MAWISSTDRGSLSNISRESHERVTGDALDTRSGGAVQGPGANLRNLR